MARTVNNGSVTSNEQNSKPKNAEKEKTPWGKWSYQIVCVFFVYGSVLFPFQVFQHFKCFSTENSVPKQSSYNPLNEHHKCVHNGKEHTKRRWNTFLCFRRTGKYVCMFAAYRWCKFPYIQRQIETQRNSRQREEEKKKTETSHSPLRRLLVMAFNFQVE